LNLLNPQSLVVHLQVFPKKIDFSETPKSLLNTEERKQKNSLRVVFDNKIKKWVGSPLCFGSQANGKKNSTIQL